VIQFKYSDKWTKIGINVGICLGNSQDNFHLHRFIASENITESFLGGGAIFGLTLHIVIKNLGSLLDLG